MDRAVRIAEAVVSIKRERACLARSFPNVPPPREQRQSADEDRYSTVKACFFACMRTGSVLPSSVQRPGRHGSIQNACIIVNGAVVVCSSAGSVDQCFGSVWFARDQENSSSGRTTRAEIMTEGVERRANARTQNQRNQFSRRKLHRANRKRSQPWIMCTNEKIG